MAVITALFVVTIAKLLTVLLTYFIHFLSSLQRLRILVDFDMLSSSSLLILSSPLLFSALLLLPFPQPHPQESRILHF